MDELEVTFPLEKLQHVAFHEPSMTPEAWVEATAHLNQVEMVTRADDRAVWNFSVKHVHAPYRWKHFITKLPNEPDMEETEAWLELQAKLQATNLPEQHESCCVAHGCTLGRSDCVVLKHFVKQEKPCGLCPSREDVEVGRFNDADVSVLEEWNIIPTSWAAAFDEAINSFSKNTDRE